MQANVGRAWVEARHSYTLELLGVVQGAGLTAAASYVSDLLAGASQFAAHGGAQERVRREPIDSGAVQAVQPLSSYYSYESNTLAIGDLCSLIRAAVGDHPAAGEVERLVGKIIECDASVSALEDAVSAAAGESTPRPV